VWLLGTFSIIDLIGFIATFALIVVQAPNASVQRTLTAAEIRRLTGPAGERGPEGRAARCDRRSRCPCGSRGMRTGNCTAECADDGFAQRLLQRATAGRLSDRAQRALPRDGPQDRGGRGLCEIVASVEEGGLGAYARHR
jgi:hypothetical protein